ncbi:unnamed protein product [Fraxinus pennsylvanica]|uniref:Pectinesterase n=1 Tax=Fraxinus pennsylvanica TaxID=56036 RepID=A0AAD1ZJ87_9LAMI|nr:unnamed protein product [Fraxinus pennsylvanica]
MAPSIITLIVALFASFPAISGFYSAAIKPWCSQAPFPLACESVEQFLEHNPINILPIIGKSDFFKASLQFALDSAMHAKVYTYSLGMLSRNAKEKAAWSDCLELLEDTIVKINMTLDPSAKCLSDDIQTWLSTALTNFETCKSGFFDFAETNNVLPLIVSSNVAELISNLLYLNKGSYGDPSCKARLPTWVPPSPQPNIVVAQDGSGNYMTVNEAIADAGNRTGNGRYVIYVKQGTYEENVDIGTAVVGDGFIARGITFRNTAGPENYQAVALRSGSDLSVFYQCSFEGYQDTLYVHSQRQFYRECDIYGTVDFIFGNAAVVFQNCNIYARNPPSKTNALTAQGRTDSNQNTGISIHNCRVMAASDLKPVQSSVRTYMGRPWQKYSRTVFMKTFLDGLIDPTGWMPWSGDFALDTLYYGEYQNTGPGSSTSGRVTWKGYRVITNSTEASEFTVANFINGNYWLPATNVPFTSGF